VGSVPGRVHGGGQLTKKFFSFFYDEKFFLVFSDFSDFSDFSVFSDFSDFSVFLVFFVGG